MSTPNLKRADVDLSSLVPHPQNPRNHIPKDDPGIAELSASIESVGLLQPLVVRALPSDAEKNQVLLGHRRLAALQRIAGGKAKKVPVIIVSGVDDDVAIAIVVAGNVHSQEVDPFREAAVVAILGVTMNTSAVADQLGKTRRWVAERMALNSMDPKVREDLASSGWPVAMLAEVATLDPSDQHIVLDGGAKNFIRDLKHLRGWLSARTLRLGGAPWDLSDPSLLPEAGACTVCPHNTYAQKDLFGEEGDEKAGDISKARCLKPSCYEAKATIVCKARLAEAKEKHGKDLVLVRGEGDNGTNAPKWVGASGEKAPAWWNVQVAAKGDKASVPAFVISGSNMGKVIRIADPTKERARLSGAGRRTKTAKVKPATPAARLKESKERTEARRRAFVVDTIHGKIEKMEKACPKQVTLDAAVALAIAFGLEEPDGVYGASPKKRDALLHSTASERRTELWTRTVAKMLTALTRRIPDHLDEDHDLALLLWGNVLAEDIKALRTAAVEAIPDPAWWSKGKEEAPKAAAKK